MVGTNLIEAYDQLVDFIAKHTLDKFFLVDNQRVSVRSWIAREVVSNILTHREYSKGIPAKIVIENDRLCAENWNRSNRHGRIDPNNFTPEAKNPMLAWFFVNIGRADWMGSGIRNLYKYTKIYSGGEPELIEGDVFKTIVPLSGTSRTVHGVLDVPDVLENEAVLLILNSIANEPTVTYAQLSEKLTMNRKTIQRHIQRLKESGKLKRIGSERSGHWKIVE